MGIEDLETSPTFYHYHYIIIFCGFNNGNPFFTQQQKLQPEPPLQETMVRGHLLEMGVKMKTTIANKCFVYPKKRKEI